MKARSVSRPLTFWSKHKALSSLYDFAVCLILYSLFVPVLHEAAHWLAAKYYGVDGVIQLGFPLSTFTPNTWPSGPGFYVMYFAGGLGVFLAYALMWSREDEIEEKAGMAPAIAQQLIYGTGEGLWALSGFNQGLYSQVVLISQVSYFVIGVAVLIWLFRYWLTLPG